MRPPLSHPLKLKPADPQWLTGKARSLGQIDPKLRAAIRRLVAGEAPWPLYLHGSVGSGKTCAALCLHDHAGGLFFSVEQFVAESILAMKGQLVWDWSFRSNIGEAHFWQTAANTSLLTLDDIGTRREPVTDGHYERVKRVLDLREGKPTVVVSNLYPDDLAKVYDDRIVSRLVAGTVAGVFGPDRRVQRG